MRSKELDVLYLQSWPENEGYSGFFVITAKDQNVIEFIEQVDKRTDDSKYSKFVFLQRDGTTYIATELVLEYSNTAKDELMKLLNEHSQVTCGKDMSNLASNVKRYHHIRLDIKVEIPFP